MITRETDLLTLAVLLAFAAALAYSISFLHNKSIGYFSLLQILYLVVIPGFLYVMIFSAMQEILVRPQNPEVFLPDAFLTNLTLLSVLFTYGGLAIHTVTKMLKRALVGEEQSVALAINKYFHLSFSHNLFMSGAVLMVVALTLLEMNHLPRPTSAGMLATVLKGLFLGVSFVGGLFFYTRRDDYVIYEGYTGRWADLKLVFVVAWMGGVLVIYAVRKLDPSLRQYSLLLPVLISFLIFALLNAVLVVRRLRRGGWRIFLRTPRD